MENGIVTVARDDLDRSRVLLWALAGLLFATLVYVAWQYVGTLVLGLFVYYVTRPVFDRIHDRIEGRTTAVVVTIVAVAVPVLLLVAWAGVVAVQGLVGLIQSPGFEQFRDLVEPYLDLAELQRQIRETLAVLAADPGRITSLEGGGLGNLLGTVLGSLALLLNVLLQLFVVLVLTFYLLRDDHKLAAWARGAVVTEGSVVDLYARAVDRDLQTVYFGNILNALVTALLGAVVYSSLNLVAPTDVAIPEPVLLGLLTGVASLVPVIGMKLVWVPLGLVLLADSLLTDPATAWFPALFVAVSVVLVDYVPDQFLRPYVSGRTLHVGAIMVAYILGPLLFGWYGLFLGPLILVVVFEFARIVVPWLVDPEREVGPRGVPVAPAAEGPDERPAPSSRSPDGESGTGENDESRTGGDNESSAGEDGEFRPGDESGTGEDASD